MAKVDLKKFEELLVAKRKEILSEMGIMESQVGTTIKESTGDLSSYSYHMADQGTDSMEREMAFMLASKSGRLLYHIDEALRRIQDGTYGLCLLCKKSISNARLEAVPHARLCIDCKSAEEEKKNGRRQ
ncbi:MAG: TraR/DksA C4-type zinc finger protein [Candidatus Zixiibacteriota bacterium]